MNTKKVYILDDRALIYINGPDSGKYLQNPLVLLRWDKKYKQVKILCLFHSYLDKLSAQSALLSFLYPELRTGAVVNFVLLYSILYHYIEIKGQISFCLPRNIVVKYLLILLSLYWQFS